MTNGSALRFRFDFRPIDYQKATRSFVPQYIGLEVEHYGVKVAKPQLFLNEARLSALSLAIYFASILETVPVDQTWPRVLVLDDVLIGLDMSNRLPVLNVLQQEFRDWQVLLLTYDKTWFEIARSLVGRDLWVVSEMFCGRDAATGRERPLVRQTSGFVARAEKHLNDHEYGAAAMYARAALEAKLKEFCEHNSALVPYHPDPARVDSEKLLNGVEARLKSQGVWGIVGPECRRVRMYRRVVLNPLSHSGTSSLTSAEVAGAILAVKALKLDKSDGDTAIARATMLCVATGASFSPLETGCCLRTAFEVSLRAFCERRSAQIRYRPRSDEPSAMDLWTAAKATTQFTTNASSGAFVSGIELHRDVFLDELDSTALSALPQAQYQNALSILQVITVPGSVQQRTFLDQL